MRNNKYLKIGLALFVALLLVVQNNATFKSAFLKAEDIDTVEVNENQESIDVDATLQEEAKSSISEEEIQKDFDEVDVEQNLDEEIEFTTLSGSYVFEDQKDSSNRPSTLSVNVYLNGDFITSEKLVVEDSGSWQINDLEKLEDVYTVEYSFDGAQVYDVVQNGNSITYSLKQVQENKPVLVAEQPVVNVEEKTIMEKTIEEKPAVTQEVVEVKDEHLYGIGKKADGVIKGISIQ